MDCDGFIGEFKLDQAQSFVLGGQRLTWRDVQVDKPDPLALIQERVRDADVAAAAGDEDVISLDFHRLLPVNSVRPMRDWLPANAPLGTETRTGLVQATSIAFGRSTLSRCSFASAWVIQSGGGKSAAISQSSPLASMWAAIRTSSSSINV